ncbi:serine hydrolase domain-containing protein [Paractinoplanes atraurantiacus]|uniref:CubicO group peptidase, beta-lactamase class C family n=1 Tax=Paractinoplanes atraurantiacus TaxID=1036182 RepID=A0A285JTT7_9ACTN|nr:serine hydrolase domain-containing protein [Actinoplanes atraurantiacus]SNY63740.1 CubicO group peptidase, beta-lactamase class C family [Actinoplanes atraurantiacus]
MEGLIAPGFEAVATAFATDPRDGSALTVLQQGEPVVEISEGWRDTARTQPWTTDTLVNVYSTGKPVIAAAVLLLGIDLDKPMSAYWPSFQAAVSVRQVLCHTAGLASFPVPRPASAWADWDLLCADLAAAAPAWEPGSVAGEHALTYGHLLGALVRRVDGRSPARFVREEIGPDLLYALTTEELGRCAELEYSSPSWREATLARSPMLANPPGAFDVEVVNSPLWRQATIPAVNLHTTATAVARFYAGPCAASLPVPQYTGPDRFIGEEVTWGYGVQFEPDGSWGHGGTGGSAGWYDPARDLAIGYVTRRLGDFAAVDRIEEALRNL